MIATWPRVVKVEGEHPWVTYAKEIIYEENGCMNLFTVGKPGKGKSWGTLSYFCQIDPDFDVDEQVTFRADKMLDILDREHFVKGKPRLFDESGIDLYNLNWRDHLNKGLNHFLQTHRSINYILGMTVPFLSFISSPVRKLMTHKWTAHGWKGNKTILSGLEMEWNDDKKDFYKKRLIVKDEATGYDQFCNEIHMPPPPKKIVTRYEQLKKIFQDEVKAEIREGVETQKLRQKKANLVRCTEVAKEIGVSLDSIYTRIHKGEIEATRIGKLLFMTQKERERVIKGENPLENPRNRSKSVNTIQNIV